MSRAACPTCGRAYPPDDVSVGQGVAYCRECGAVTPLADLVSGAVPAVDPGEAPPPGCRLIDQGSVAVVRASCRHWGAALGLLAVCLFWNGIVSVFVLQMLAGWIAYFFGSVPAWWPSPGSNGNGNNQAPQTLGMTIFLTVFLIPFMVIGLGMIAAFLNAMFGRIEVRITPSEVLVRSGVGVIGPRRRIERSQVKGVRIGESSGGCRGARGRMRRRRSASRGIGKCGLERCCRKAVGTGCAGCCGCCCFQMERGGPDAAMLEA